MKNPFKSREPMTPAQKKIVAGVACIVLIVVASLAFDFLLARRDAQPETDSVTVAQTAVQDDSEQDAEAAEAEATQPSDDEESQATPYSEIGIGESYDAGDIALVNDSEYVIGEEGGALIGDLRAFLIASGIDYDGAEFTVVAFVSSNDTGSASFFMTSDLSGAQYLQATRIGFGIPDFHRCRRSRLQRAYGSGPCRLRQQRHLRRRCLRNLRRSLRRRLDLRG